ncbi:MAG TPA: hypothetical protein VL132_16920 [Planctomycetaceae bacterium]|nr:hypothetical protein [Planctomycetaceae bacterium]
MTALLREPFFLRGRTSVLQRAVLMSLVLGGLAAIASWIVAGTTVAVLGPSESSLAISITWGLTAAIFIHAPIQHWNGRSWWRLLIVAVPISAAALYIALYITKDRPHSNLWRTFNLVLGFTALLIINGAPLVRRQRLHLVAYAVSALGGIVPALIVVSVDDPGQIPLPGIPEMAKVAIVLAAIFGGLLAALSIPWGLPFWWPPADRDEPANPQPAPPPTAP